MKAVVYNKKNEKAGEVDLPEKIFGVKWNPDLVYQVLNVQQASSRVKTAHAKGRGDVSGGGKKPWQQKGTGRARHGSIRSPLWKGGGVTFGPSENVNYSRKINKKMKRSAVFSVLSRKLKDERLKIVDNISAPDLKTKSASIAVKAMLGGVKSAVIIASAGSKNIGRAFKNIKGLGALSPKSLNVYDLMKYRSVILEKDAVKEIADHYSE